MLKKAVVSLTIFLLGVGAWSAADDDARHQQIAQARNEFIEAYIGPVITAPRELDHMATLFPGGGLYEVEAQKLSEGTWAYLTFGLTNPDIPAASLAINSGPASETGGGFVHDLRERLRNLTQVETTPVKKAGYGYEMMVLTRATAEWPYVLLEWIVDQEILGGRDFLSQVEENGAVTIKDVRISDTEYATVLITKAHNLPGNLDLPNGRMQWLVATTITDDELVWARENGTSELLKELERNGVGQHSDLKRASVIHPQPIDYKKISSRKEALKLYEQGLLRKVYLFPPEFGGDEEDLNAVYLPRKAAIEKKIIDERVLRLARQGKITNYGAAPQYLGSSFIPSAIEIRAIGEAGFDAVIKSWEEKPFKVPSTTEIYRKLRAESSADANY